MHPRIAIDALASDGAAGITETDLLRFYEYDDALDMTSLTSVDGSLLEPNYSSISTGKNLSGKISGDVLLGAGKTADTMIRDWIATVAANSEDPAKLGTPAVLWDTDGRDLAQMINKLLLGSVVYYQATGVYMAGILGKDNSEPKPDKVYTAMEHAWDEAFGYYGASRDYRSYSDDGLAGKNGELFYGDTNNDGLIDFESEYNFGFSRNAGKRDRSASDVNFTEDIFAAFIEGRTHIVNGATQAELLDARDRAAGGWEKVIAATVVHYINDTAGDMAALGTPDENRGNLSKHWSEMKGFAMGLQYNPIKEIGETDLTRTLGLLGDAPSFAAPGTGDYNSALADLMAARDILQAAYGFSSADVEGW